MLAMLGPGAALAASCAGEAVPVWSADWVATGPAVDWASAGALGSNAAPASSAARRVVSSGIFPS